MDGVKLEVEEGSVHAIMGENGAGKSTLMKVLFGQYAPDEGEIFFKGEKVSFKSVKEAVNSGISMIYQELSPIKDLSIAENVFVGRYPKKKGPILDVQRMYDDCQKIFDRWGLDYDPHALIRTLKTADIQMIEIIKAISFNASLVIMDEPSSSISQDEVEKLFDFIRTLKKNNITVIIITHKIDEVFTVADEVTVLRDGKYIGTDSIKNFDRARMIKMMVGREMTSVFPQKETGYGKPLLEVQGLNNGSKVRNVSFTLHEGEILGFAGIVGAGRTETMRSVFGLDPHESGSIKLNGEEINIKCVRDSLKHDIVMATESRKDDGLVLCRSVGENILLPSLYRLSKHGVLNVKNLNGIAEDAAKKLAVKTSSLETMANFLSGGNQQKVILSKWLLMNPKVLILDEPTRGIDVGAKWEIYNIIIELAKQGVGIILVSSEMEEVINLSDRILVMCDGQITGELSKEEVSQEKIMNLASEVQNG
ncbi:MAG: sugar ABC transporter ATP-binding protein [Eubacteriales bacterium]|nr:sugar ABC transporter ATP-binding protein [Eubacteriales bacterium]